MTDKEKYIEMCKTEKTICIYDKPFYLDAVCGENNWSVILVSRNDDIVAALPYYYQKSRLGIRSVTVPPLTQHNGIWLKYEGINRQRIEFENDIYEELIEKLEELNIDYYKQSFATDFNNWQPFYWHNFKQQTYYTYILNCHECYEDIISNMSKDLRRNIQVAEETAELFELTDISLFYKLNCMTFERQGKGNPHSYELVKKVYETCSSNNACKVMAAKDNDGHVHCAGFYIFDDKYVYEIMLGTDPQYRKYNYKSYMTAEMIRYACETNRDFDFEGSMLKGVSDYYRRFNADLVPYFQVRKLMSKSGCKRLYLNVRKKGQL